MACTHPIKGYKHNGRVHFKKPSGHSGLYMELPCRKCMSCRLDHRGEWVVRMTHEASQHTHKQFVTFTYADEHLPDGHNLSKQDHQNFFKRLRHKHEGKIRYVWTGEYGGQTSRPHYHAIIFGLEIKDRKILTKNQRGEILYTSEWLEEIWGKGQCVIGDVTEQSCGYVVGYMLKDTDGNYNPKEPYTIVDPETGEYQERVRPYSVYSSKPGIGGDWIEKWMTDVYPHDRVVMLNAGKHSDPIKSSKPFQIKRPPKYYDKKHRERDLRASDQIKEIRARYRDTDQAWSERAPHRREAKRINLEARLKQKPRGSESEKHVKNIIAPIKKNTNNLP